MDSITVSEGGTVDSITVSEGGTDAYSFTNLGLSGLVLGNATRNDRLATNNAALENLFRNLTWAIEGRNLADAHQFATSFEGLSVDLTRNNTYWMDDGDDTVAAADGTRSVAATAPIRWMARAPLSP